MNEYVNTDRFVWSISSWRHIQDQYLIFSFSLYCTLPLVHYLPSQRCFTRQHTEKTHLWGPQCMLTIWTSWPLRILWFSDNRITTHTISQVASLLFFLISTFLLFFCSLALIAIACMEWQFRLFDFTLFHFINWRNLMLSSWFDFSFDLTSHPFYTTTSTDIISAVVATGGVTHDHVSVMNILITFI